MKKEAVVVHSGGMDSSICLALAIKTFGANAVLSLSFDYQQRHAQELAAAAFICREWGVDHRVLRLDCLTAITESALLNSNTAIEHPEHAAPNTLVEGRNGLFCHLAGIHASHLGANTIFTGVMELESENSGYRDCSRAYMDQLQALLQLDLANPHFVISTPLVRMTKVETLELAHTLGKLDFLLTHTVTCYNGIPQRGCGECPSCKLRNQAVIDFYAK